MIEMISGITGRAVGQIASEIAGSVAGGAAQSGAQVGGNSFSEVLQSMGGEVVSNLRTAEVQSFKAVAGEANTREVVDALMSAEQSLQTAIAIRDKLVTAYLEIGRMQI